MIAQWQPAFQLLFYLLLIATMLAGLFSLLTVIVPGLTIIWAAIVVYAIVSGIQGWDWFFLIFITIQMIIGTLADNVFMGAQTKSTGAPWWSIIVAMIGGIIGSILIPPFGGIIVSLAAIFVIEFIRLRDWKKSFGSMKGMATGCSIAVVFRFAMGLAMILVWVLWAFVFTELPVG